ncbi:Nif11-like leader peptide family natural product precursor [Thermodesulfobacteriota bacterium]
MSVENVKAFFENAAEDKALQEKLKDLAKREADLYADLVRIASEAGFEFTTADVRRARIESESNLSNEELDVMREQPEYFCPLVIGIPS